MVKSKGNSFMILGKFRLVKYYNLTRHTLRLDVRYLDMLGEEDIVESSTISNSLLCCLARQPPSHSPI